MLNGPVIDCVWSVDRAHQLFNGLYVALDLVRHILAVKIGCLNVSVGDRLSGIVEVSDQVGDVRNSVSLMQFSRSVRLFPMPPRRLYSNMEGSSLDGRFETIEPVDERSSISCASNPADRTLCRCRWAKLSFSPAVGISIPSK